jgi:hypothetical protein
MANIPCSLLLFSISVSKTGLAAAATFAASPSARSVFAQVKTQQPAHSDQPEQHVGLRKEGVCYGCESV